MQPSVQEARPPYVVFERRPIEDRAASVEAGRYVAKDADYAIVTPAGSKDRLERVAGEWLDYLRVQVGQQRFPEEWERAYRSAYERWKTDQTPSTVGTAISNWPPASPAQVQNMIHWNVRTVEDLAAANEETIGRLGMGARDLKRRAVEWLASANDIGKTSERTAALEAQVGQLITDNAELRARNEMIMAQLFQLQRSQPVSVEPQGFDNSDLLDEIEAPVLKRL